MMKSKESECMNESVDECGREGGWEGRGRAGGRGTQNL